jgi:hypothetical protein
MHKQTGHAMRRGTRKSSRGVYPYNKVQPMLSDFLNDPLTLVFVAVLCCWFFLSSAPKLTRYGVLSYGVGLGIQAMAFEGLAARLAQLLCTVVAALLLTTWAYRVTNRPRTQGGQAIR